jgi:hypothetical protein
MNKRHVAIAVLMMLFSSGLFAAPPNDDSPRGMFGRAIQKIVREIKRAIQPLDGLSPPHP